MEKKPLTSRAKNLYGIADFGFSFVANVENYYLMFFLTSVAKLPLAGIAAATSLAYTADTILQPIYSALISALKPMRWGKNRSYQLLFPPLVTLTFILLFTNIGPPSVALFICGLMLFLTNGTRTMSWSANLNMINVLASNSDERSLLASRRATWTAAAGIIYSYSVGPGIVALRDLIGNETIAYGVVAGITGVFYMITSWITVWATSGSEPTGAAAKAQAQTAAQKITLMDILRSAFQNPYLLVLLGGAILSSCFNSAVLSATTYYYTYIALNPSLMSMQLLLTGIAGTIAAYFSGAVGKKFSTKGAVIIGMFGAAICNLIASMVAFKPTLLIGVLTVARVFTTINTTNMVALYGDCVVYARWKTGKDTSAFVMGSQTIPIKVGLTLRGILIPIILTMVNFDPNVLPADATMELKQGIITMFLRLPAIGLVITGLIILFGFRLTRAKVDELQKEINEREVVQA